MVGEAVEGGAALALGRELDMLNKELRRLQEERRIHAMVMLAERDQRQREAEESGMRQREERSRRIQDEMFKQVCQDLGLEGRPTRSSCQSSQMVHVQHGSVESYLEDIILQSVENTGDQQAREEIHRQAAIINNIARDFQHTYVFTSM